MVGVEEKIAFIERHVEDLDSALMELYDRLAAMERDLARLREEKQRGFEASDQPSPEDEKPPHW